jgi:hypothetical protein
MPTTTKKKVWISTGESFMDEDCPWVFRNILIPYFHLAESHGKGKNIPYAANFYTDLNFPSYYEEIRITGPKVDSVFYDTVHSFRLTKVGGSSGAGIFYNNKFCGVLQVATQTLVATDWTHLREFREITQKIINHLVKNFFLFPKGILPMMKVEHKISVGCDPEFELLEKGEIVCGCDHFSPTIIDNDAGNIGLDGAGGQIEIRPQPSNAARGVVDNIKKLLGYFAQRYCKYRLAPSSERFPCGGHIHIGVEPRPNRNFYCTLTEILDDFIGAPTKRLTNEIRERDGYGCLGDYREQPHGMEYRTPSAAIFRNPRFAEVVLELAGNIAKKLVTGTEITYDVPVGKKELVETGELTGEKAEFYLEECGKQGPRSDECLLAAWGVEITEPPCKITLSFSDDWTQDVKAQIIQFFENRKPLYDIEIRLYGLHSARGEVYTFPVPGSTQIEHPHLSTFSGPIFGFPFSFRAGLLPPERVNEILEIVARILHNEGRILCV